MASIGFVKPRRWLVVLFGTVLVLAVIGWINRGPVDVPRDMPRIDIPPALAKIDFAAALVSADKAVADKARDARAHADDWHMHEALAAALLGRARLTGSFDDYLAARKAADAGFAVVKNPIIGPHFIRASIALATHRLDDAAADLDKMDHYAAPAAQTVAEATALRGDIALYRGHYEDALRLYAAAAKSDSWYGLPYRRAIIASQTGKFSQARAALAEADTVNRFPSPAFRSDILLRQGELDLAQGDWPAASAKFAEANQLYPGAPRIQMRVAQMLALAGGIDAAIREFVRIAAATGQPEAMDIAAGLYRAKGDAAHSKLWSDRAGAIWAQRLAQLPEAAWGHALEHELAFGDPSRALAYAKADASQRPFGVALIGLAKALTANRQPQAAAALLEKVNASGWQSVEQHLALADAYTLLGNSDGVAAERAAALAINPKALGRNPAFVWLDH